MNEYLAIDTSGQSSHDTRSGGMLPRVCEMVFNLIDLPGSKLQALRTDRSTEYCAIYELIFTLCHKASTDSQLKLTELMQSFTQYEVLNLICYDCQSLLGAVQLVLVWFNILIRILVERSQIMYTSTKQRVLSITVESAHTFYGVCCAVSCLITVIFNYTC